MKAQTPELCHCGRPLHYTDPDLQEFVRRMIEAQGEFIPVQVGKRWFNVQRHYLALHGLRGVDVARLGFEEIKGYIAAATPKKPNTESKS